MSKRAYRVVVAAVAFILVVAAWDAASPWWTLKSMRDAAKARDSDRLAAYIDFPRVRSNVREQLIELAETKRPVPAYQSFVRRYGASLIADPVVDLIVSPEALRVALLAAPSSRGDRPASAAKRTCGMQRESLSRFRVRCAKLAKGGADLLFERRGLGWRLVGVDLPDDYGAVLR